MKGKKSAQKKKNGKVTTYKKTPLYKDLNEKITELRNEAEIKWQDVVQGVTMIPQDNATPYVNCVSAGIVQGTASDERIGDRIKIVRLSMNIYIHSQATFVNECRVRVIVLRYKNSNGVILDPTTLLDIVNPTALFTQAFYNNDYQTSFQIYYDKEFVLIPEVALNATTVIPQIQMIKIRRKLNVIQKYNQGVAGTYADINDSGLWILATTSGSSATLNPNIFFTSKVEYIDS